MGQHSVIGDAVMRLQRRYQPRIRVHLRAGPVAAPGGFGLDADAVGVAAQPGTGAAPGVPAQPGRDDVDGPVTAQPQLTQRVAQAGPAVHDDVEAGVVAGGWSGGVVKYQSARATEPALAPAPPAGLLPHPQT